MTKQRSSQPVSARHVYLYDADWDYLDTRFGPRGVHPIGISKVIRQIIHKRVGEFREVESRRLNEETETP